MARIAPEDSGKVKPGVERDADLVAAARAALRAALSQRSFAGKQTLTKAEQIRALRPDIAALRAKGATWDDVAAILAETLGASADTIRQAIGATRKAKKPSRARTSTQREPTRAVPEKKTPSVTTEQSGSHKTLTTQF
ncbi:MAG: hypothetical protein WAN59_03545 [Candidatus Baltobacteraceae bacterium]